MLVHLTGKEFLNKVAGSDPVPGGGSIAALNGAIASALAAMVANLTVGKKGYEAHEELMQHIAGVALQEKDTFIEDIDRDSEAYDSVFACFKMPKATDEEKAARKAYDALSDAQKELVTNYQTLLDAEKSYKKLTRPTGGSSSSSTTDDKKNDGKDVKSGNTGDAGITLYLGMGLVAVMAGAVIVTRKRKEN